MHARRLAGLTVGLLLLLLAPALAGCGGDKEVVTADEGDCIEDVSFSGGIDELPTTDCDQDHVAEVVGTFDHRGGDDFPGEDDISEAANERCGELFEDYVGAPVEETSLAINSINPTEESWEEADDRETICLAVSGDGDDLDQSVEDAAEDFEAEASGGGGGSGGDGEDTSLEDFADLVESCEDGDLADCDQLYLETPVGSEAETVGATCGGQSDDRLNGRCEDELG